MTQLTRKPIEMRIADVPLEQQLDVIAAAIAAIREAHRDVISVPSWAALNVAQEKLAEATLYRNEGRQVMPGASAPVVGLP